MTEVSRLMASMTNPTNPWHAHVYYDMESWDTAQLVHQQLSEMVVTGTCAGLVLVGQMYDKGVGPHLQPQFEIQFYELAVPRIAEILKATGLIKVFPAPGTTGDGGSGGSGGSRTGGSGGTGPAPDGRR